MQLPVVVLTSHGSAHMMDSLQTANANLVVSVASLRVRSLYVPYLLRLKKRNVITRKKRTTETNVPHVKMHTGQLRRWPHKVLLQPLPLEVAGSHPIRPLCGWTAYGWTTEDPMEQ